MKESKEAILGLVALGKFVSDRLKDGVQLDDAIAVAKALVNDGKLKELVSAGYQDADKIAEELQNLNLEKILDLAKVLPQIADIVSGAEQLG